MKLLQPKFLKYKKIRKGKLIKFDFKSRHIKFGNLGLKALESGYVLAYQLKSIKDFLQKKIKKNGKVWFRIFPNIPLTSKPLEVRMGKGKGTIKNWGCRVGAGKILIEIITLYHESKNVAILNKIKHKLAFKTKIVKS